MAEVDDEIQAILDNKDLDTGAIAKQVLGETGEPGKADPVKEDPAKADPGKSDPGKTDPKKDNVPDLEKVRAGILNEMFGDQFKSWDEVKKADIPTSLKDLETLRRKNQELETQINAKPKHHFANDDIAKLNEFIRETGKDAVVFNKIYGLDVANTKDMDALILAHVIENPRLAGKDPQDVRAYFEMKYNVDPSLIDPKLVEDGKITAEELAANKRKYNFGMMEMEADAQKAKEKILDLQSKIKMPEIPKDDPAGSSKTKWTPEVETKQKDAWTTVGNAMLGKFDKIPLSIKNKEGVPVSIANFALPEKAKTDLLGKALKYVVDNQMEVNETNVTAIANAMYSDIRESFFEDILSVVFERARSMTEKEYLESIHNPSKKNTDHPDKEKGVVSLEDIQKQAYELEIKEK